MSAELKVGIGADVKDLEKGLKQGEQSVKQFAESSEKSLALTDKSVKSFSKTAITESKKTGVAFQGLSRVMSDAAFGPGAIANNLAGLGDDFKQLSLQAKESGQSIGKTLVQSLAGGGGLNLALGGLTLAMSLASFGLGAWTRMFGDADDKVKKSTDTVKDYIDTLDSVTGSRLKGSQNAQSELAQLKVLMATYQNANLPLKTRKEAYDALQKQWPETYSNLQFEKEASDKLRKATDDLVTSIIKKGRAEAATAAIAAKSGKQLENLQKIADEENNRIGLIEKAVKARKNLAGFELEANQSSAFMAQTLTAKQVESQKKVADSIAKTNALKAENLRLDQEILNLTNFASDNFVPEPPPAIEPTFTPVKELPFMKALQGKVTASGKIAAPAIDFGPMIQSLPPALGALNDFTMQINEIIQNGVIASFENMGAAIGDALANGGNIIAAAGMGLLSTLGGIMIQLGQLAIGNGIAIEAIKKSLTTLQGVGAIAAGVALVALGTAVRGKAQSLGKSMGGSGGGISSPSAPGSGFQPGNVQFANGQSANTIVASYTIKGQDLHTILTRTTALNGRMGGK